jgi:hypothetical protein
MAITDALKASRIVETLENYSVAADTGHTAAAVATNETDGTGFAHGDENFWRQILDNPEANWNRPFNFGGGILSNWTPRIPGLFFAPGSEAMRAAAERHLVSGHEFAPVGKSVKVIGGVGALALPPDNMGFAMYSFSFSSNSSVGIPALISPEVQEAHQLKQGCMLEVNQARWVKMTMEWAQRFPSIKGIPRGYLLINKPEQVVVIERNLPVEVHPCTIMEYEKNGALLYDYVYVVADTSQADYRKKTEAFFEYYRTKDGRNGRYLLACDMAEPMFDAVYQSPADLRTGYDNGQMALMLERIRNTHFNTHTVDELAALLPALYPTAASVKTLTTFVELPAGLIKDDSAAKMIIELLHKSIEHNKMEELIDRVAMDHPGAFKPQ